MDNYVGREFGPYKLTEKLGRGGMADVYKAYHIDLEVSRAIKVIRPEFVTSEDFKARFLREAQAVAALRHPNIVQIHDFGSQDESFYMVMEYIEGEDLKKTIRIEGAMRPISRTLDIVKQISAALEYAHGRDVLHRDIKPENIMLNSEGVPILMDFGIAKLLSADSQLTQTGVGIGTPSYMSPEQAQATDQVGPASDIYSLAVVLYEMLTGRTPFTADTPIAVMLKAINDPLPLPRSICDDISESLQQVLIKGTAKDPLRRYRSGGEFAAALQQDGLAHVQGSNASPLDPTVIVDHKLEESQFFDNESEKPEKKSRLKLITASVVVVALLAAGYIYLTDVENTDSVDDTLSSGLESKAAIQEQRESQNISDVSSGELAGTEGLDSGRISPVEKDSANVKAPTTAGELDSRVIAEFRDTLATGESKTLEFNVQEKAVLYFEAITASATTDFVIASVDDNSILLNSYGSEGPLEVKKSGAYTMSITPRNGLESNVDVRLWTLSPVVIDSGELEQNTYIKGETFSPGQAARHTFYANAGDTLYLNVLETSATVDFTVMALDGRKKIINSYGDKGPVAIKESGTYSLMADPRNSSIASYDIGLFWVSPAIIEKGEIGFDVYQRGATKFPGQQVSYDIDIQAGTTVYFELNASTATTDFNLISSDGREKVFTSYGDVGPVLVKNSDRYTLMADPRSSSKTEFDFKVHKLDPAVIEAGKVVKGQGVSGATTIPGQIVSYGFDAKVGDKVELAVINSSATTDFVMTEPDGRKKVFSIYGGKSKMTTLNTSGEYRITVDPRYEGLSEFEFILR